MILVTLTHPIRMKTKKENIMDIAFLSVANNSLMYNDALLSVSNHSVMGSAKNSESKSKSKKMKLNFKLFKK